MASGNGPEDRCRSQAGLSGRIVDIRNPDLVMEPVPGALEVARFRRFVVHDAVSAAARTGKHAGVSRISQRRIDCPDPVHPGSLIEEFRENRTVLQQIEVLADHCIERNNDKMFFHGSQSVIMQRNVPGTIDCSKAACAFSKANVPKMTLFMSMIP